MSETRKAYEAPRAEVRTEPFIEDPGSFTSSRLGALVQRKDALTLRQSQIIREMLNPSLDVWRAPELDTEPKQRAGDRSPLRPLR